MRLTSRIHRPVTALQRALSALTLIGLLGTLTWAAPASAQLPRLFVVGDSVILGAEAAIGSTLGGSWDVVFDADVSRSTSAGASVIAARKHEIGDTVVVQLGTNDAGTISIFEARIDEVMQQLADVPKVVWVNIREVRDYYPAANQALRNAEARWPNLAVADWNAYSNGIPDAVYDDGLHLTASGAQGMANMIAEHLGSPTGAVIAPAPGASAQSPAAEGAAFADVAALQSMLVALNLAALNEAAVAETQSELARSILNATASGGESTQEVLTPPPMGEGSVEFASLAGRGLGDVGLWLWVGGAVLTVAVLVAAISGVRGRRLRPGD